MSLIPTHTPMAPTLTLAPLSTIHTLVPSPLPTPYQETRKDEILKSGLSTEIEEENEELVAGTQLTDRFVGNSFGELCSLEPSTTKRATQYAVKILKG